jgi:hypothetical protein
MNLRMSITVTLVVCLLVSGLAWTQGKQPVCPCWPDVPLEAAIEEHCPDEVPLCGFSSPGDVQIFQLFCVQGGVMAQTERRHAEPPHISLCRFSIPGESPILEFPDDPEFAACLADLQQVCAKSHP